MRTLISTAVLMWAVSFQTNAVAAELNLAIGSSVPVTEQMLTMAAGPSRAGGGERFLVTFGTPKMITGIKITAYSSGRLGKALIHNAVGLSGTAKISLDGLSKFTRVTTGNPTNYNGKVMLTDSSFVEVLPNQAFKQLELTVEGFTNDDSSILLQIISSDALPVEDFLITRTGPAKDQVVGGLIDESRYAQFSPSQLQSLMTRSKVPAIADLAGKNFSCSSITKLNPRQIDFKKRSYLATAQGVLQSESDLEGATQTWSPTAKGMVRSIDNTNGCGRYTTYNVVRTTSSGNLISEVVVDLEAYVKLCVNAGYDEAATRAVEANSTFPSSLDPKYVVDSYEYCKAL